MKILKVISIIALIALVACPAYTQEVKRTAKIMDITGGASVKMAGEAEWMTAENDMDLNQGDAIKTGPGSWVLLNIDGSAETATVEVDENSTLLIAELMKDEEDRTKKTLLDLAIGKIMITVEKVQEPKSKFEVKTPTSTVGVRGTKFAVQVSTLD